MGTPIRETYKLSGGCIGYVWRVELTDGRAIIAKFSETDGILAIEEFMLSYLSAKSLLPVPTVLISYEDLMLMQLLPSDGSLDTAAEINAADAVADLHRITQTNYGFECDTLIGGLLQPNPLIKSWIAFFRDARLFHMADKALVKHRLPVTLRHRIDHLAERLDTWLSEPSAPALLHGDLWGGNILCANSQITGFIDPALYFGAPEIELAFVTLFNTFSSVFFDRYKEHHGLNPGFFEERRDIYNLYPLLVHIQLFGDAYLEPLHQTLAKYGC